MSVAVVGHWHSQPGQEAALLAAAAHLIQAPPTAVPGRRSVHLLQGVDEPAALLFVAEWDSREAYEARLESIDVDARVAALLAGPPQRYFFRPLLTLEIEGRPLQVATAALVETRPPVRQAVHRYLLKEASRAVRSRPGFAQRRLYVGWDNPDFLLLLTTWDSLAALESFVTDIGGDLTNTLRGLGATVQRFVGHLQAGVTG